jgi:transcriptional regulator with XRE-family HTH domain
MEARAGPHQTPSVDVALGQHVKRLRRARGLTQEQLAERSGLSSDTIRRLEHGSFSPSLDTLTKLCEGLSLSLSTLFTVFELADRDDLQEIVDLLASRPLDQYRLIHRLLLTLFAELDRRTPTAEGTDEQVDDDLQGHDPPDESVLIGDDPHGDEPE